jgi:acetyl-CoA C-acetyltransferase
VQAVLDAAPKAELATDAAGQGRIGTYTVVYAKGVPDQAIVIGDRDAGGRFIATSREADVISAMLGSDPLGRAVIVTPGEKRNSFVFS